MEAYLEDHLSMHFLQYRTVYSTGFAVFRKRIGKIARFGIHLSLESREAMRMRINLSLGFLIAILQGNAGDCSTKIPSFME